MKTLKNKVYGIAMILIGLVPVWIDGDATALLFFGLIGLYLICAKDNWIY